MDVQMEPQDRSVEIAMEITRVSRQHFQQCARVLEDLGIGVGHVPVLTLLMQNGVMPQRELAAAIHVTPATMSGTLKRMERDGLVTRSVDEKDARVTRVRLSEKGRELCNQALDYFCGRSSVLVRGFSADEIDVLHGFIRRMCQNLEDAQGDEKP